MNPILHSTIIGEGFPMIIIHGFLGMSDNWRTIGSNFAKRDLSVHLVDQRNHGRSFHSSEFNYNLMAEDLFKYFNKYQIDKAIVLGHSMGGKVAMSFATTYPERVSKLVVVDIASRYYPPHHQDILNGLYQLTKSTIKTRSQADEILKKGVKEAPVRAFLMKNLYRDKQGNLLLRINLETLIEKADSIGEPLEDHKKFEGKVLFIKGSDSGYIKDEDKDDMKKHFPEFSLKEIDNSGHWVHADNQEDFLYSVLSFILIK